MAMVIAFPRDPRGSICPNVCCSDLGFLALHRLQKKYQRHNLQAAKMLLKRTASFLLPLHQIKQIVVAAHQVVGFHLNRVQFSKVGRNPTNGSWWIVQIQPTSDAALV